MKCAQHVDLDAVGFCNQCSRGLCAECVSKFSPPTCPDCVLAQTKNVGTSVRSQLVLMASLFGVSLVLLLTILPVAAAITYAVMAGFFPAGWAFLGRYFSPSGGYLSPVARWMNLLLQAAAAACLGVVLGPIYLYKAYRELAAARDLNDAANKH